MFRLICLLVGYVCGNVLFAEVVARVVAHRSIFDLGNGNPGMANTARSLGPAAAVACLVGDLGKVILAVLVCSALLPGVDGAVVAGWAGIGATLGHDYPLWRGFRGGKGVATLSATIFLVSWRYGIVAAAVAAATLLLSGYLSIAAVVAAAAFALLLLLRANIELALVGCAVFALALCGQWTNLWGIRDGTATRDLSSRR